MTPFAYRRAASVDDAVRLGMAPGAHFLGGGTNLVDLAKGGVVRPLLLVDVSRLPLAEVLETPEGGVHVGAMARNSDVANHALIRTRYPLLSQALLAGASPQLRNMATIGGNLLQRTRCPYFYDIGFEHCNKRMPGSGCGAVEGINRNHAILGASAACIATHPSDMCVALAALRASVRVRGPRGERAIAFDQFHRLPGDSPQRDTTLDEGELVIGVDLPPGGFADRAHYLKLRDRASYAFALVSVAAALDVRDGVVRDAALALGGVAHKPWRRPEAEARLIGGPPSDEAFGAAADALLQGARPASQNGFKVTLARRAIVRALQTARSVGMTAIGAPLDRVDGPLKVCGQAHYTGDLSLPRMAHAVLVTSTIASGRVAHVDAAAAERAPGVVAVISHVNAIRLPQAGKAAVDPPTGRVLSLLQDDRVAYDRQPIALVVAETVEQAAGAAALVRVSYERAPTRLDFGAERRNEYAPDKVNGEPADTRRGDIDAGLQAAAHRLDAAYTTPLQHHNPMEPHATLASWDGERLSVEDSTQYVAGVRKTLAKAFGIPPERVHVRSAFVGGAFGGKGSAWSHVVLAALAARQVGRPVRLVMQRPQLFGPVGGRPRTAQTIRAGADADGRLTALEHRTTSTTSTIEDWVESSAVVTRMLYASPAVATAHRLVKLNVGTPTFQRAPGESTGMFALESAMDEMAFAAGLDPIEFRLRNDARRDDQKNAPYSSKALLECYREGAQRIVWSRRSATPGGLRDGHWQVGLGCASATRPAKRSPCAARVRITADGRALVSSSTADLGTGTYTVMAQVAADALGLPVGLVRFELGDTALPEAPISAGSMTMESVGSAIAAACARARAQLVAIAITDPASPLHGADAADVLVEDGWLRTRSGTGRRDNVAVLLSRRGGAPLVADGDSKPGPEDKQFSMNSFGAVFAEVHVDRDLGIVRVPRIVGRFGAGRIINAKTAHSQLLGGIVWGLGMALTEESVLDPRSGRFVNANLAEYHVMVNADIGDIDVAFVDEVDPHVNSLGAKGLGEVSMTGVTGAVANAIFNATGRRIRDLPITLDKLL